jgi:hypothetical protein
MLTSSAFKLLLCRPQIKQVFGCNIHLNAVRYARNSLYRKPLKVLGLKETAPIDPIQNSYPDHDDLIDPTETPTVSDTPKQFKVDKSSRPKVTLDPSIYLPKFETLKDNKKFV